MNTINEYSLHRIKKKDTVCTKTLSLVHRLLVVISIYLIFGLLFQYVYAGETTDPNQSRHGSVWLLPDNGSYLEAVQLQTDVNYEVTGAIARARVKQQFKNDSGFWSEGIYVFPLPENAAVDQFKMIIGERTIEGRVKERAEAKRTYENAKAAGKKTSLIEQQRPNIFTTSLANIAPGEVITVEFEYQQILEYRDHTYRLRYPMVVGPRYHPDGNNPMPENSTAAKNPANDVSSVATETDLLKNTHNPTRIHVQLDAGVNLAELRSSYHEIHINQTSETRYSIATVGENILSDRDFELVWQPELTDRPQLSLFNEQLANSNYTMLTLLPPDLSYLEEKIQARDVIFVLDISGSMSGTSIEQAKASLLTAVAGLTDIDRFNIIWFNDQTGSLFPDVVSASAQYKNFAEVFIKGLQADGGTEMLPAMKLALAKQEKFSRLRQVVFLTDGNISNEAELFEVIDRQLGDSRLFTIGIGSAPNSYFMRKAANKGRGTFTYIGDLNEVKDKTITLFKKLETPALINLQIDLGLNNSDIEMFPQKIPDLYAGEPLTLFFKSSKTVRHLTLKGDYANSEWLTTTSAKEASHSGIRLAWAREKIASLMSQHHESTSAPERQQVKQEIIDTALRHHLVSHFTSMVAVDVTPLNDSGMLYRERMKNNLPHGWEKSSPVKNSTPAPDMILASLQLPQTASSSRLNLLLAMLLLVTGLLFYRWRNAC